MRPLWVEFPSEEATFAIDDEFMLGSALLVHPVVAPSTTSVSVYFPTGIWYDLDDLSRYSGPSTHTVDAPKHKVST